MQKVEPRWGRVAKVTVIGVENMIANQQALVIQARASCAAIARIQQGMRQRDGEEEMVWMARQEKFVNSLQVMREDLAQKTYILEELAEEYKAFMGDGLDFLDGQVLDAEILEDTNETRATTEK